MKPKVTASSRGGVGSNRRRTASLQGTNPIRRRVAKNPRGVVKSGPVEGPTGRTEVTAKATFGRTTWLGVGCPEGKWSKRRDLLDVRAPGRSQSPHSTEAAMSCEKCGEQKPRLGKVGRKVEAGKTDRSNRQHRQCL
jgi:hypothetical protein